MSLLLKELIFKRALKNCTEETQVANKWFHITIWIFRISIILCVFPNLFIIFSEFFHTEKSHVRNLKVLDRLFFRPLLESGIMSKDLVEQLFPNLEEVLALHNQYNQKMKERASSGFPVGNIGDMLSEMVNWFITVVPKLWNIIL